MTYLVVRFIVVWLTASSSVGAIFMTMGLALSPLLNPGGVSFGLSEFSVYFMIATFGGVIASGLPCLMFGLIMIQLARKFGWARHRIAWAVLGAGAALISLQIAIVLDAFGTATIQFLIGIAIAGFGAAWLFHALLKPMPFLAEWYRSTSGEVSAVGGGGGKS